MSQEMNNTFKYNGCEYTFDARDAEDAAKFEAALDVLSKKEASAPKDGKASDMIKYQCDMIKEFLDSCLGTGAGEQLCTSRSNSGLCYNAYIAFLDHVKRQKNDLMRIRNSYGQYSNRQQRRHGKKNRNPGNKQ